LGNINKPSAKVWSKISNIFLNNSIDFENKGELTQNLRDQVYYNIRFIKKIINYYSNRP
jgi:hypothetical protein